MSKPKILVLGAGGTGGYFGGRLAESGADVTFLVREGRRKMLSEQGLRIESPFGDAQIAVKTVVAPEVAPVYDAVILTCKAYDLDTAIAAIAPAVAPTGYVLPFLNGIAHIDILNEKFGRHRVLGGTAKIQATIMPNGAIRQFNDWRTLTFGEQSGEMSERVRTLVALFEAAKGMEVVRGHRHRAANVGKAGPPLDCGRHNLSDACECWRDCPHSLWPRSFSRSASLRRRDRCRQWSCTERGFHEIVGGDVLPAGFAIFDIDAARHRTGRADGGRAHPRLHAGQGGEGARYPATRCCSPTPTSRLSSNGAPQGASPNLHLREFISSEAVELKRRSLHRGQLRIGRETDASFCKDR